jgi:hypothetical protein
VAPGRHEPPVVKPGRRRGRHEPPEVKPERRLRRGHQK